MNCVPVTSMSKDYFDNIGHVMIETWLKHWNIDSPLHLYSEDDMSFLNSEKIKFINWNDHCYNQWLQFSMTDPHESELKFAKKGYSLIHAWETLDYDKIIWFDADIIFLKKLDTELFEKINPNDRLISLFTHLYCPDRYVGLSSESGLIVVNKNHRNFLDFLSEYKRIYDLGFTPEEISGRGDHKILMLAAYKFYSEIEDLSKYRTKDKTTTPINHSWISEYITHYKGNVKKRENFLEDLTKTILG